MHHTAVFKEKGLAVYIRWVVRKHKNASVADMTFHDAYLVESFRDEVGNPRQRTISYLGNIREIGDEFPTIERELFMLRAERILSSLPELNGDERNEVLDLLRQRVLPLSMGTTGVVVHLPQAMHILSLLRGGERLVREAFVMVGPV